MDFSTTSKLQAVNTILTTIGESPVNSLEDAPADAVLAESILDEIATAVQVGDWYFNRDPDVELPLTVDGEIFVAANVIRINPDKRRNYPHLPVLRTNRRQLYDKHEQSYTFPKAMIADVVYLLDWGDLPQPARSYITARAARVFNDRSLNSESLKQSLAFDEERARIELAGWDAEEGDFNIFDSPDVARTIYRRGPIL